MRLRRFLSLRSSSSLGWQISDQAVQEGMAAARLPARLEVLSRNPLILLDGAHNPDGIVSWQGL